MVKPRRQGRYFGPRINCERVPLLPASIVRWILDNSRTSPLKLIWQNPWDLAIEETVWVRRVAPPVCFPDVEAIEVRRSGESITDLHLFRRPLPRNGGTDLFFECPGCRKLRRALYGWKVGGTTTRSVFRSQWQCRECCGLRYASEGGALLVKSRGELGRILGVMRAQRPKPWLPYRALAKGGTKTRHRLC
jgi:hypothetical protein